MLIIISSKFLLLDEIKLEYFRLLKSTIMMGIHFCLIGLWAFCRSVPVRVIAYFLFFKRFTNSITLILAADSLQSHVAIHHTSIVVHEISASVEFY